MIAATLTWIVPAGQYKMEMNSVLGKEIPISGTYTYVARNPQGMASIIMAPIIGFYDPESGQIRAIDISLFILIIGGFIGNVIKTGAVDAFIRYVMSRLSGREEWVIPIFMSLFTISGTIYGMAEESLPFYGLLIPVVLGARFDSMVAASIILIGSSIGILGSTINPFATIIASDAAGISFIDGILLRIILLVISWVICVAWVMRYARKVRHKPSHSIMFDQHQEKFSYASSDTEEIMIEFNLEKKIILTIFLLTFVVMIYGMLALDWWMAQISAVFLVGAIAVGLIAGMSEEEITSTFINGAKDLVGLALIVGVARGIVVIMDKGLITHTILHSAEKTISGLSTVGFINVIFLLETALSFFIPSSSSLAILTMPVIAPLADFANVSRDLVVTAYQAASGIVNLINPISVMVMGGLSISRIPYFLYVKWIAPLLAILTLVTITILSAGVFL